MYIESEKCLLKSLIFIVSCFFNMYQYSICFTSNNSLGIIRNNMFHEKINFFIVCFLLIKVKGKLCKFEKNKVLFRGGPTVNKFLGIPSERILLFFWYFNGRHTTKEKQLKFVLKCFSHPVRCFPHFQNLH